MTKWNNVSTCLPKPYQVVRAKGTWKCDEMLFLDDQDDGLEQKCQGRIEVTHWKPKKNGLKS